MASEGEVMRVTSLLLLAGTGFLGGCAEPAFQIVSRKDVAAPKNVKKGEPQDDLAKELDSLQGSWRLRYIVIGGAIVPEAILKKAKRSVLKEELERGLVIKGDKFAGLHGTSTIKLDLTKKPKQIDLVNDSEGITQTGIYMLEGDTLRIYFPDPNYDNPKRPTDFSNRKGVLGYVYRRMKK
jgi:uncharacterized protein (TIGR03067 family)